MPDTICCDFCSSTPATWNYPAQTFTTLIGGLVRTSEGDWAACDPCHALIEAGDMQGLARRSADLLFVTHPQLLARRVEVEKDLAALQAEFTKHRTSPVQPVAPDEPEPTGPGLEGVSA